MHGAWVRNPRWHVFFKSPEIIYLIGQYFFLDHAHLIKKDSSGIQTRTTSSPTIWSRASNKSAASYLCAVDPCVVKMAMVAARVCLLAQIMRHGASTACAYQLNSCAHLEVFFASVDFKETQKWRDPWGSCFNVDFCKKELKTLLGTGQYIFCSQSSLESPNIFLFS